LKYDISIEPKEILSSLKLSSTNQAESILWQTYDDSRSVFNISNINVDELRSIVEFNVIENNAFVDLAKTAYIKLAHRNTIFKGDVLKITSDRVFMSIPDEVQLEEFREVSRYHFSFKEKRTVGINVQTEIMTNATTSLQMQVMDLSVQGLGLYSSVNNKDLVLNSSSLGLSQLGEYNLPVDLSMQVIHSDDHRFRSDSKEVRVFKFGVKLEHQLDEELIDNFIARIEGRHKDEIGFLAIDDELQGTIHEEMNKMFSSLLKSSTFSKLMKSQVAKSYSRENYLKEHIRLLARISCGIASELGMYDKRTIKNLTYAAYTHDIAYFNEPKLALIKNDQHFLKVKENLSMEDHKMYKKSLAYFEDFVEYDTSGSSATLKIVRDFYDMRNRKLVHFTSDYSSLSCIFMVSHHLVDYIILRKNWSFYNYLESYQKSFSGGTFDLIYDALQSARLASEV